MSDLNDLFNKDPLSLTKDDMTAIKRAYREAHNQFNLGVKQAGATKKIKGEKPKITNLDDILGDIL